MTDAGTENNSMALNQALCWYQKKISAYDKQSWEETVEQRILSGLAHVPKKSGKLKLEYIDLDLVRGSAFPKVKAKHGLGTVIRLGLARFALLPFYKHWWTRQTSPRIYNILFILYSLQLFNMTVFFMNTSTVLNESEAGSNTTIGDATESSLGEISSEEVLLPILMMGILSVLLSQMGSAHTSLGRQVKRPRSKLRTRRAKRRSNRRISIAVSDSKSSLETLEQPAKETQVKQVPSFPVKKRSCSEERPTPVKTQQRSSSLQLEPSLVKRKTVGIQRRPSWFGFWPARLGVPSRTNEDEGFDSFHGNNSSSSDVEPEENTEQAAAPKDEDAAEPSGPSLLRRRRHALTLKVTPPPLSPQPEIDLLHGGSEGTARKSVTILGCQRRNGSIASMGVTAESSYQSSCESDGDGQSSVASPSYKVSEPGTPMDWTGVTTNSEECSYSSETGSESDRAESPHFSNMDPWGDEIGYAWELHSSAALSSSFPASDKVSCTVWEAGEPKKADLSVLDISAAIIAKVDSVPESTDYLCGGLFMAAVFSLLPIMYRANGTVRNTVVDLARAPSLEKLSQASAVLWDTLLGASFWEKVVAGTAALERFVLAAGFLFLLSVAERTFKQRFLYSKLFSYLTSSRRARNSDLPHFRLNKVRNIKTWLSVRSYLKKRGPQRSVDCIVSTAFVITLLLVSFLCMELLKESQYLHQSLYNLEVLCWCLVLGVFLLRFMTLGSKINKKYRNLSVLITEQINLYLQMEQKPTKKEELMLANNVLKLAADLLKELESPFKISGFSANPYLYNLTKVVVLSALSGVLSEMLGFKLKLHKIKLR